MVADLLRPSRCPWLLIPPQVVADGPQSRREWVLHGTQGSTIHRLGVGKLLSTSRQTSELPRNLSGDGGIWAGTGGMLGNGRRGYAARGLLHRTTDNLSAPSPWSGWAFL